MANDIDKDVESYLLEFGLSLEEIKIYITLLELGRSSVLDISKKTEIKRSTAHNYIESLIEKGIVSQTNFGGRRMVIAEVPEKLKVLLEQRKLEIQRLEGGLVNIIDKLNFNIPDAEERSKVEIKYYEGRKGVKLIYEEALQAREFRAYVRAKELSRVFPENVDLFLEAHEKRKDMTVWEIMEDSMSAHEYVSRMSKDKYYVKFIPKNLNLSVIDNMIFDGKVAIVNLEDDTSGMVISNLAYYENAKSIFEFVWQMLPESKI